MMQVQETAALEVPNILGISAKSIHVSKSSTKSEWLDAAIDAKRGRYELQRVAQTLLFDSALHHSQQKRVVWCQRTMQHDAVGVFRQSEGCGARLTGLTTCGSVWHCPICAAKIAEARRKELSKAMTAWINDGGSVQLLTLTFPHRYDQRLADIVKAFTKALQSFKNCRAFKRLMSTASRAGSIRSLEATHGCNGWHPHTHDLVFLAEPLGMVEIDILKSEWYKALRRAGLVEKSQLSDVLAHGLDLQDGSYAAEYIAKFGHDAAWGASSEMTKPHAKVGTTGEVDGEAHYTPFQLLAWAKNGDEEAAALFREFAEAFEGKRMLSWSRGLRKKLTGLEDELTDEQIAAHDDQAPDEVRIGNLDQDQFALLLSRNMIGELIAYVARCCTNPETGQSDIDEFVEAVKRQKKTHGSAYRYANKYGGGYLQLH